MSWLHAPAGVTILLAAVTCGPPPNPRLIWEGAGPTAVRGVDTLAPTLPAAAPGVRSGDWGESPDATFRLLRSEVAEQPHVHAGHDLTVLLLQGTGVLVVAGRRHPMRAGDVVHVARGRLHHFHPDGPEAALGLAIFTPRLQRSEERSSAGTD